MDSAAPGVMALPVTTAGATGEMRGKESGRYRYRLDYLRNGVEAKGGPGSWFLQPFRMLLRLPGLADARLRRDFRMALAEHADKIVFVGDSTANPNDGDIVGLQTAGITETTLTQANKVMGDDTLEVFADMIDGLHALDEADLRHCLKCAGVSVVGQDHSRRHS